MKRRHDGVARRALRTGGLVAAALIGAPHTVRADPPLRLVPGVEFGAGTMITREIRNRGGYDLALQGTARLGLDVASFLAVQVGASGWFFPAPAGDGSSVSFDAGLRLNPRVANIGWLLLDLNGGLALTGGLPHAAFDVGIGFEFSIAHWLALGPVARYGSVFARPEEAPYDAQFWSLGLSIALRHAVPTPPPPATPQVVQAPDVDHDGVPDARDRCPRQSAGAHADPDRLGCPEGDADADGVLDHLDWCRIDPAGAHPDLVWPGCPLPDEDGDGVPDRNDPCSHTPAGNHPDPAWPGCPLPDEDLDGVFDADDRCPSDPAGNAPDPDRRGCPDGDRDRDGILDHHDECPAVSAGLHPDLGRSGCPQPDADHDAVPDTADRCPNVPGAPSTNHARNGCAAIVIVRGALVELPVPTMFARGTATLRPNAPRSLTSLAEMLHAAPEVHRLTLRAAADDTVPSERNDALARLRAETVRYWLIAHGVEAARISVWTAEASPTASGSPAPTRQIEFRITDPVTQ